MNGAKRKELATNTRRSRFPDVTREIILIIVCMQLIETRGRGYDHGHLSHDVGKSEIYYINLSKDLIQNRKKWGRRFNIHQYLLPHRRPQITHLDGTRDCYCPSPRLRYHLGIEESSSDDSSYDSEGINDATLHPVNKFTVREGRRTLQTTNMENWNWRILGWTLPWGKKVNFLGWTWRA